MEQPENLPYGGTTTGEALNREVLSIEIREARDLLSADLMKSCEPYVVMTIHDGSGRPIGTRKTNVVAGTFNPYWMERFEFQLTQWDKEGGYVELTVIDNRNNERLGYIRQPLFRLSETGTMEGWYFLDRARHHSAALSCRMLIHPYRWMGAPAGATTGLASGISARQPAAATGIGVSGVGSRTPLGPTVYGTTADGFASPSGLPMGATPATATPAVGAPGMTPVVGPVMAREPGTAPLFIMRRRFWGLANTYEVKDSQGLLRYRLMGNFGDKLDDIRIADSSGHEVGYIREESSLISRVYRMPTYLISVYGTSAKLKKKLLSLNEPIFSLRPFNASSIHAKGNFGSNEFSFYQGDTIIADVSKALAVPSGEGLYGIRVAPTFSNPLLILAATVAMDRIHDVTGLRPIGGVYSDSKRAVSKVTRRGRKTPTVVTTTATPVATVTTTPVATTTARTVAATTTAAAPVIAPVAAAPVVTPVLPVVTPVTTPVTPVAATPIVTPVPAAATATNPYAAYYDERGVPTTPVVSVTTVPRGETLSSYGTTGLDATATTTTAAAATMQPRAEIAARETLRQEAQQQMMQAERVELAPMGGLSTGTTTGAQQYAQGEGHLEKERDQKMTRSEIRQAQPVQIPIMGAGTFD